MFFIFIDFMSLLTCLTYATVILHELHFFIWMIFPLWFYFFFPTFNEFLMFQALWHAEWHDGPFLANRENFFFLIKMKTSSVKWWTDHFLLLLGFQHLEVLWCFLLCLWFILFPLCLERGTAGLYNGRNFTSCILFCLEDITSFASVLETFSSNMN